MTKKSLGQNFLTSQAIAKHIADSSPARPNDLVIEIGPGKGMLTRALLEKGFRVYALEKDRELIPLLEEKFREEIQEGKLVIKEEDVLLFDPANLQEEYHIIANIPYYITGAILERFLSATHQPQSATLLLQKEVSDRIVARDGKESILSLSVKAYGAPHVVFRVHRKYFNPIPKVHSAVIVIENISRDFFNKNSITESLFFEVVKTGFKHPRKQLFKNLKEKYEEEKVRGILAQLGLKETLRAEDLPLNMWGSISSCLGK